MTLLETPIRKINEHLELLPGFYPYTVEDIRNFLDDPKELSLGFKKDLSQGYLYGLELAALRRNLFNSVIKPDRVITVLSKIKQFNLERFIESFLDFHVSVDTDLVDAVDIGMGHSVFRLTFNNGMQVVLKHTQFAFEPFYSDVLRLLGLPAFNAQCIKSKQKTWMISDYIPSVNLTEYLQHNEADEIFVKNMAAQAALGDALGRGDRHFENYIISHGEIYPVDISHLFWPYNDEWVYEYVKGGQSEFCLIELDNMAHFWESYDATWRLIQNKREDIRLLLERSFSIDQALAYYSYFSERIDNAEFMYNQERQVERSRLIYRDRKQLKQRLEQMVDEQPDLLKQNPMLAMYYYSNLGRQSTFFLIDQFNRQDLLDLIR